MLTETETTSSRVKHDPGRSSYENTIVYMPHNISGTTASHMSPTRIVGNLGPTLDESAEKSVSRRLSAALSMSEARRIVFDGLLQKLADLIALSEDDIGPHEPLADLGLDFMMVVEFKNWLESAFDLHLELSDITDATGLVDLASLVVQKSSLVSSGIRESVITTGFVPNQLPRFPVPDINVLFDAFLTGVKAFASPAELATTQRAVEEFKTPGSTGRALYDRAVARAADPNVGNWEFEPQLQRFLDRRVSLTPCIGFWFGHPLSKRQHSQVERAALIAYTANNFRVKLAAGLVGTPVLHGQELTTAYYPWIFNAVRIPGVISDEMARHPGTDYCIVFWRGHAFQVGLSVGKRLATQKELATALELILQNQSSIVRSYVPICTADDRGPWAETRQQLQRLDPQNAASIANIEAAAFTISLDEASPATAVDRGRQFHLGGEHDAANRWHDKSLQFIVCSNGASGTLGEHSMLDAMTMPELNKAIATAIARQDALPPPRNGVRNDAWPTIRPTLLPLKTDAALDAHIAKTRIQYASITRDAEHVSYLFSGYGSSALRLQKLPPNSVFQIIVQLAAQSLYDQAPPCFETVNQAHYHQGRVDLIQVVTPPVAAFLSAARDPTAPRRVLLGEAARAHAASINKARRNLGYERNLTSLRGLLCEGEPLPALYDDPVYQRVRPRLMISNCFQTGMMEKGCMTPDPEATWVHYEVYEESVYFSVVTKEGGRATRFCEHVKDAAELVRRIVFTE